jgi:crotonobetainyl-CoA:carnitine CoA-transferase CaiB-like acyl-CoA transferase
MFSGDTIIAPSQLSAHRGGHDVTIATRPPLEGLRVLAVEQYGAGPWGSLYLADLGAEVIKIEHPHDGGDTSRRVGPYFFAPGDSQFFHTFNRNKKSAALDLKHPEGMTAFRDLVRASDAVLDNLRGDGPGRSGLPYAHLTDANPRNVGAHLSAYGREGPRASWPGYDYLMQAEAGYLSVTGEPDAPPTKFGLSMVDLATGVTVALALLAGVLAARASGRGRDVDASLFDTALHNLNYPATWYLNAGAVTGRQPRSAHPSLVPSQLRSPWPRRMMSGSGPVRSMTLDGSPYSDPPSRNTSIDLPNMRTISSGSLV